MAATGAPPGSDMPSPSHTECMELAVPMPEHTPGEVMAASLMSFNSSSVILPVAWWPAPRNTSSMSMWWPRYSPLPW